MSTPPPPSLSLSSASIKHPFLSNPSATYGPPYARTRSCGLDGRASAQACSAAPFDWAVEHTWTAATTMFAYAAAGVAAVAVAATAVGVVAIAVAVDRTHAATDSAACVAVRSGPRELERMQLATAICVHAPDDPTPPEPGFDPAVPFPRPHPLYHPSGLERRGIRIQRSDVPPPRRPPALPPQTSDRRQEAEDGYLFLRREHVQGRNGVVVIGDGPAAAAAVRRRRIIGIDKLIAGGPPRVFPVPKNEVTGTDTGHRTFHAVAVALGVLTLSDTRPAFGYVEGIRACAPGGAPIVKSSLKFWSSATIRSDTPSSAAFVLMMMRHLLPLGMASRRRVRRGCERDGGAGMLLSASSSCIIDVSISTSASSSVSVSGRDVDADGVGVLEPSRVVFAKVFVDTVVSASEAARP
ncbi:hypothetical protein DFH11DRAFT_1727686 [Phellopilus nigrolimitatus]|nr:hypothetical protein DFH11DRAFT_1727686 [Phellopilus nigrolimitatus]